MSNFFDVPATIKSKYIGILYGYMKIAAIIMMIYASAKEIMLRYEFKSVVNDELLATYTKLEGEQKSLSFSEYKQKNYEVVAGKVQQSNSKFASDEMNDPVIISVILYIFFLLMILWLLQVIFEVVITPFKAHEEVTLLRAEILALESRIDELEEERYVG